jgi:hypothetical protein
MLNVWINQDNNHSQFHFCIIRNRILDIYKQGWYSSINNSRRLVTYSLYKHEFECEKYLKCILPIKYKIALSRFRLSSHDLAIETGRHRNIPVENRICTSCQMNLIENEYHFLLICPKYYNLRKQFFSPYYCHWPTLQKFETLLSSKNPKVLNNLAKYIYFAFKERNNT